MHEAANVYPNIIKYRDKKIKLRVFLFFFLLLPSLSYSKIYDCFPFFNELELLKIRMDELNDVVDYFVLVESIETQRGNPKKLYFKENQDRFARYLPKIIHVIIDESHPDYGLWQRENYQRNCILRGLSSCNEDDIILISDVDEIPRKNLIPLIKKQLKTFGLNAIGFEMTMYRFQLNRTAPEYNQWWGTVATTYDRVLKKSPQFYRDKREKLVGFKNAGWHFTWMGDRERIRQKMKSVVEGMDDISDLTDESVDQWIGSVPAVRIDHSFPTYIRKHEQELKILGFIADY